MYKKFSGVWIGDNMAYTTIDDPSEYFTTLIYTGNATDNRNLTNNANAGDFKPDWLWLKERGATSSHQLHDSTRGSSFAVMSDSTAVEDEDANRVQAFQTNGFQVGTASTVNQNNIAMVAWQWKANGGTTTTNDASSTGVGSIDSVIQANTTAGFSIVTYTGNGTEGASFAHGLGVAPDLVIIKGRSHADNWPVFNGTSNTTSRSLHLEGNDAEIPVSSYNFWNLYWDETRPSSTVVTLGVDAKLNGDGRTFVAYCFVGIPGYSKLGTYVGNGSGANSSANGTFVYTGFKPAWVMVKATTVAQGWNIFDNKRTPTNEMGEFLFADTADAETTGYDSMDFLSNGFKLRRNLNGTNDSDQSYVYLAFAEHPFVSSTGTPTTAG
jgi:hypothetical protein